MSMRSRSRLNRLAGVALCGMAAAHVMEALVLRRRRRQLDVLPPSVVGSRTPEAPESFDVATAPGVDLVSDPSPGPGAATGTPRAAIERELAAGSQVVDLVPGDLPSVRALRVLRRVEPGRLRSDRLYMPGGANQALARASSVTDRMVGGAAASTGPVAVDDLHRLTVAAQRYAPATSVMRVAPDLQAGAWRPEDRHRELDAITAFGRPSFRLGPVLLGAESLHLAAMLVGLVVAPVPAAAALATWSLQPAVTFTGPGGRSPGLRPRDLGTVALRRLPEALRENAAVTRLAWQGLRDEAAERSTQVAPSRPSPTELFEPRRATCPWCGDPSLVPVVDVTDMIQFKPGTFHLDGCSGCGHIFQNPALTVRGLDHYYDQFYDGASEEAIDSGFVGMGRSYRERLDLVARFMTPESWLDVGTGHGHFCLTARERWPEAVVDGMDMGDAVEEAERRGWVDRAYRGMFPDLAGGLGRPYDVVSMHHYLEHTREPRREISAAAKVLEPGGHLLIEVPDPEYPWRKWLGRYWLPWFQPQHQHLVPVGNLADALEESGFELMAVERGPATMGGDLTQAVALRTQTVAGPAPLPWLPPEEASHWLRRLAVYVAAAPVVAGALAVDKASEAWVRRSGSTSIGNAYRVLARRL